jgi:hypothetical protein
MTQEDLNEPAGEEDPDKLADALAHEGDELERRSSELEQQVKETRQEWQRKRADGSVPGAPPPEEGEEG